MKYDIVVVEPFLNDIHQKIFFKNSEPNVPNLRLVYFLKNMGMKVKFIDLKHDNISFRELMSIINSSKLLMLDVRSYNFELSKKIIQSTKTDVFVHGQMPTSLPEIFSSKFITLVGDISNIYLLFFTEWINHKKIKVNYFINKIKKLSRNNLISLNYDEAKLDDMPFVDIDEIKSRKYHILYPYKSPVIDNFLRQKFGYLSLTFGCPFNCIFCSPTLRISTGKKVIHFSLENALHRIKRLVDAGFKYIRFMDDEFTLDHKFVKELMKLMIKEKLNIRFTLQTRITSLDDEVLGLLKKAGAYLLCLGFESASDKILRVLKKGQRFSDIKRSVKLIKKHNFRFVSYFMIGSPNETIYDVKKSMDFSLKIHPDVFQLAFFTIYPGSPIFYQLLHEKKKMILKTHLHYRGLDVNMSKIPMNKLKKFYLMWYLKYYLFNLDRLNLVITPMILFRFDVVFLRIKNFVRSIIRQ